MKHLAAAAVLGLLSAFAQAASDPFDQSGVVLEKDATDPRLTKIVLLAGTPSNKSGQHEYFAGCALMMDWLKANPGVHPVMARDGWPKNEAIFKGAKAVVYFGDGGGKQPFLEPARWKIIESLMAQGAGLVLLHQGVDFPKGPDVDIQRWTGAVWRTDIGCRGHWDMEFTSIGGHAVLRGVKPFKLVNDGWLYNVHFAAQGVTPLLAGAVPDKSRTTPDAKKHTGRNEAVAWAAERAGGGRGFAFTGCDLHQSWEVESQRKLVVNGILWAAGLNVPESGAKVPFKPEDLQRNLDTKPAPAPVTKKAAAPKS
jgi:type 1 glutamine amidotransferase